MGAYGGLVTLFVENDSDRSQMLSLSNLGGLPPQENAKVAKIDERFLDLTQAYWMAMGGEDDQCTF